MGMKVPFGQLDLPETGDGAKPTNTPMEESVNTTHHELRRHANGVLVCTLVSVLSGLISVGGIFIVIEFLL